MRHSWILTLGLSALCLIGISSPANAQSFAQIDSAIPLQSHHFSNDLAIDPFLAGALGFIPFTSGLYLGPEPAQGLVFTLLDVVLVAGAWNALHSKSGDPDNAPLFLLGLAANNAIDTYLSVRKSLHTRKLRITPVTYNGNGCVSSYVTVHF